ncbi:terminase large subunit [Inquilinus sp. CA228]|uniref:terminase large subunit n=1 Tax=Inquilinus sp. CA228 TaxID=3455609 RepID=UPI003F8D78DC
MQSATAALPAPRISTISGTAAQGFEPEWIRAAADDRGWDWARIAWRRAAAVPGSWYDAAKADKIVGLWPRVFRLTNDRFVGLPFQLSQWEEVIVRLLVGWKAPVEIIDAVTGGPITVHVRLFRRLLLWIPRKGGKSEFMAALAILFFAIEGIHGGEGYVFARDEKQARIVFGKMKAMLALSPAFKNKAQSFKKSIWIPQIEALFELLPGKADGKHGRSATVIVGDEMHEWVTTELATTLRQSSGARLEPIELYASTAALKSNVVGYDLWQESKKIQAGEIDDPTTLVVIFAADPEDDWSDEKVWHKVNPTLGLSPTLQFIRREFALTRDNPRAESHFKRYHLNLWVESVSRWLPTKRWAACMSDPTAWQRPPEGHRDRRCFGAFDVSSTQDITALVLLFEPLEGRRKFDLRCRFWVPEETMARRVRDEKVPYDRFFQSNALETTPGDYVDQDYVKGGIEEAQGLYNIQRWGFDPWNARKLQSDLVRDGADADLFVEMRQGIRTLGEPSRQFEGLVFSGNLDHGGHPVLSWMATNAVIVFDRNMNFMPAKDRSAEKIDGIAAAVMATGLAMAEQEEESLDDFLSNPVIV